MHPAVIPNTVTDHIIVTVVHLVGAVVIPGMAMVRVHTVMLSLVNIDAVMPEALVRHYVGNMVVPVLQDEEAPTTNTYG